MYLQFFGTSSGMPTKERHTSALGLSLGMKSSWFLVDCGEGTQHQILRGAYSLSKLKAIFITHVHGDHCLGLPGLLASASLQGRRRPLALIGPRALWPMLEAILETTQMHLDYKLRFSAVEDLDGGWQGGGVDVRAFPLSHRVPSYAYRFSESEVRRKLDSEKLKAAGLPAGPLWGVLQKGEDVQLEDGSRLLARDYLLPPPAPRCAVVAGDNDTPELLREACRGSQILVHEATYSRQHREAARLYRHCDSESIARFAAEADVPNLLLTHFSSRYGNNAQVEPSLHTLEREAREHYSGSLFLAQDLARYALGADGILHLLQR